MKLGGIKVALMQLGGMKEAYEFVHEKYNIHLRQDKVVLMQLGEMKETYEFVHGKYNII